MTTAAQSMPTSAYSCYLGGPATATIEAGIVHGTSTSMPAATASVNKFLGIPFAKSPPTRFAPPEPAGNSNQVINATAWKPACIQQFVYPQAAQQFVKAVFNTPGGIPAPEESEDCLYLNVYAPSTPAPCDGRPVLFWIYGGSWQFGTAGMRYYDGSFFASYEDVIVVTVNYRTNVFGFATTPELPIDQQNLGFLDQRMALDWVQRNIRAFGGSPDKVTVFGESAGAFSIDALLTSYGKDDTPPFRGAILQSGQVSYNTVPRYSSWGSWQGLAAALNCSETHTSNLTCIRAADATVIKTIIEQNVLTFVPTFDNITFHADAAGKRLRGDIPNIPVLGGTNSQEGRIFEVGQNDSKPFIQSLVGNNQTAIDTISSAYPLSASDSGPDEYSKLSQIFTEYVFQCPAALWAYASASVGIPTWRYYYNASFVNTNSFPGLNLGVYHSSEIPLVFGSYLDLNVTTQEFALSAALTSMWAKFARNPRAGPGWNQVGTASQETVLVGASKTAPGGLFLEGTQYYVPGSWNLAVLGNRHDVLSSGVTVIDSQEVDHRCGLFEASYRAVANQDMQAAMYEAESAARGIVN